VRQSLAGDGGDGLVLVSLETEAVLDALSRGIVVLDAQLCAVYANVLAEDMLALRLEQVRGQPLATFLLQPQRFLDAVHRVLESGQAAEFQLHISDCHDVGATRDGDLVDLAHPRPSAGTVSAAPAKRMRAHHA
jgi:PAS domain-containing protein